MNLVKMTYSGANYFDQVSWLLEKDCNFFYQYQHLDLVALFWVHTLGLLEIIE